MDPLDSVYRSHHASGARYERSLFSDQRGRFLSERIGQGQRVLDIGCRDGVLTATYAAGNDVTGADIDGQALERAHERLGIRTVQCNLAEELPFADASFDFVVAGEVLEHLYFPERVVARIARVLKPEGALLGSVPNAFSLKNRLRLFMGRKTYTPLNDPTHINHFSRREVKEMLERHFADVRMFPLGRFGSFDRLWPGMFSFMLLFDARRPK